MKRVDSSGLNKLGPVAEMSRVCVGNDLAKPE